jgi:hypothetical protein
MVFASIAFVLAVSTGQSGRALGKSDPTATPSAFAFILPPGNVATFRQSAQISVSFMLDDSKRGQLVCRRVALTDGPRHFQFAFDQGPAPATILVWKGAMLRASRCKIGNEEAGPAVLYVSGTTMETTSAAVTVTPAR